MEFSRQEYWSGLPFPSAGDRPTQGLKLGLLNCRQILYLLGHLSLQGSPVKQLYSSNLKKKKQKEVYLWITFQKKILWSRGVQMHAGNWPKTGKKRTAIDGSLVCSLGGSWLTTKISGGSGHFSGVAGGRKSSRHLDSWDQTDGDTNHHDLAFKWNVSRKQILRSQS